MKKIFLVLLVFAVLFCSAAYSQFTFSKTNEEVKVKGQYAFSISSTGYATEIMINNKAGDILLTFVPFKIQNGWQTEATDTKNGSSFYRSGTSYTYFYEVSDGSGEFCDVPVKNLYNMRNAAKFVINFGLIKNEQVDKSAFQKFCIMHGKVKENLKYFK